MSLRTRSIRGMCSAGAIVLVATLAACSPSNPQPEPTGSAAVGCSPEDSTITWRLVHDGENVLAAVQVVTVIDERTRTMESIALATDPHISGIGIDALTRHDPVLRAEWEEALIADASRTGQVPENYGGELEIKDDLYTEIDDTAPGSWVIPVAIPQRAMPFSVDCGDVRDAEGTLYAATPGTTVSVALRCDLDYSGFDPVQLAAVEYCPEG